MTKTNWKPILTALTKTMTLRSIAELSGMASAGHVHDLKTGKQETVSYDIGVKLMLMYKRLINTK
jgi:hypothetical protein